MNLSLKLEVGLGLDYVVLGSFVIKTGKLEKFPQHPKLI